MSTYQDEIFNYLTKKDNFFSAYEIHQLFPQVKSTLIKQFWPVVKSSLEELAKDADWEIELSDNIFDTYSKLTVWVNESFGVAFERLYSQPYYGLVIDFNNKKLDRLRINQYAEGIEEIKWMKKNDWWLGWTTTDVNFDNIETLKKILPDNNEDFAQELANQLFDFCNDLKDDMVKMSTMIIK